MVLMPQWLEKMPNSAAKSLAKQRFLLRLAALYASESGTVATLAFMIGQNWNTVRSQAIGKCRASEKTWREIRRLLGSDFVPTEVSDRRNMRDSL